MWAVETVAETFGIREDDYTLKLAVFHTIFNVIGVVVLVPFVSQLVDFLERTILEPKIDVVEPRFLMEAVTEFPETLLEAVRNEAVHLYDNAVEIISHGVNLHRTTILQSDDLDDLISRDRKILDFNLDSTYEQKVKALYASILEFIAQAQGDIPPEFTQQLYDLRQACRQTVMTVKDVKHLRKNISRYMVHDNEYIRNEYNALRIQLANLLQDINELRMMDPEDRNVVDLDVFRVAIDEESNVVNGGVDRLIREGKITPRMGTSLMNDYGYARDAIWQLTDVAKTLFGSRDISDMEAEELIGLDEDDVEDKAAAL